MKSGAKEKLRLTVSAVGVLSALRRNRLPGTQRLLRIFAPLCVVIPLLVSAPSAHGQAFGTISGTVTDPAGSVVPGAQVAATESGTSFSRAAVSDSSGHYVLPNLRPTQYTLSVEAKGFRKFEQRGITLLANQSATLDVKLQVGSSVQTVTVTSAAPLVNTTTQTLSDVVERARMI